MKLPVEFTVGITLVDLKEIGCESVDWIHLAKNR